MPNKRKLPFLKSRGEELALSYRKKESGCKVFGDCGGCSYLDIDYKSELEIKSQVLIELFAQHSIDIEGKMYQVVASPNDIGHRSKSTFQYLITKNDNRYFGVSPFYFKQVLEIEECVVARREISDILLDVKNELDKKVDSGYHKRCNVVIRSDGQKLHWGGIGKGSLRLKEKDYLKFEYNDIKIYYSLITFFQSNLEIIPKLLDNIGSELKIDQNTILFDLYSGVGLFGLCLGKEAYRVHMIELNTDSVELAKYNIAINKAVNVKLTLGHVEKKLSFLSELEKDKRTVAIVDPPRAGLYESVVEAFNECEILTELMYLSCNPETQARDLKLLAEGGWEIVSVIPYDFFPKSYHIESLVFLKR